MLLVTLNCTNKQSLQLRIPTEAKECKYRNLVDFEFANIELIEWIKENSETFFEKKRKYILLLIKCISKYCDVDFSEFLSIDSKYLKEITDNDLIGHFEKLNDFNLKNGTDASQLRDVLLQIYSLIINSISEWQGQLREYGSESFEYTYLDAKTNQEITTTFYMPTIWKNELLNSLGFVSISLGQLVEILDVRQLYASTIEENKDTTGAYVFTKVINEISILALKKDGEGNIESIPCEKDKFQRWILERSKIFYNIDTQTALDIQLWFESYWHYLQADPTNYYFFNDKEPMDEYEMKAREKMKAVNEEIFQRLRWRGLFNRMLAIGAFNNPNETMFESTFKAPATEAIALFSAENSTM